MIPTPLVRVEISSYGKGDKSPIQTQHFSYLNVVGPRVHRWDTGTTGINQSCLQQARIWGHCSYISAVLSQIHD